MEQTATPLKRILIATKSPLDGQAIDGMVRDARLGTTRTTNDSREIVALYEKWPFRVLVLDIGIGPRAADEILSDLGHWIETRELVVLALLPQGGDEAFERYCADLGIDTVRMPPRREDIVMHVRWCLHYAKPALAG